MDLKEALKVLHDMDNADRFTLLDVRPVPMLACVAENECCIEWLTEEQIIQRAELAKLDMDGLEAMAYIDEHRKPDEQVTPIPRGKSFVLRDDSGSIVLMSELELVKMAIKMKETRNDG